MLLVVDSMISKYDGGFCHEEYFFGDVWLRLGCMTSIFVGGHFEQRRASLSSFVR